MCFWCRKTAGKSFCLAGTVVEVLPKDKKKKEEDKSAILGQCSVDLLPMLTGCDCFFVGADISRGTATGELV